jgi:MoxR-like ATPase
MIDDYNHALVGPAASVLGAARQLAAKHNPLAVLLEGDPGVGKGHVADTVALELTGSEFAIEHINGQSLSVDTLRLWKHRSAFGNLFSAWTVKRVDEIDQASSSAMAELLSYLDYLPRGLAIIATTNEFAKLRTLTKGRLESRFIRLHVDAPSVDVTTAFLRRRYRLARSHAEAIAGGAVPEGCLPSVGCNMRSAINDAKGLTAAQKARAA